MSAGIGHGPGLALVLARQRIIRAVLDIQITSVSESHAGSPEASAQYGELAEAARSLIAAEDGWQRALEERAARYVMPDAAPWIPPGPAPSGHPAGHEPATGLGGRA